MGRSISKREQLELLTTNFSYRMLVGETVLRFLLVKDLLIEEEPAREKGQPFPLGDVAAWVSSLDVSIDEKDRIKVLGRVEGKVVFYSTLGSKEVTWQEEEFRKDVDLPGALPGMEANGHARISFIGEEESPLEAEGKILYQLKIEVEVLLSVVDPQQLEVAVGVKDVPPEKVSHGIIIAEELVGEEAVPVTLSKEFQFEGEPQYIKSLNGYFKDFSWDLGKEGISLKGELVTVFYFFSGKERGFKESRQQFSQLVAFPPIKKGYQVSVFPRVEYAAYEVLGTNVRQMVYIDIFLRVTRTVQQEVISDIQGAMVKKEYLLLPKSLGVVKESLELVQKLSFPYPEQIASGSCRLLNLEVDVQDGRINVSGTLEKNIYYLPGTEKEVSLEEESEIEKLPAFSSFEEEFQCALYLPGAGPEAEKAAYFSLNASEFAPTDNNTLQISHGLLEAKAWVMQEFSVVVPYRVPPGTSMVIYAVRQGDTLLKIARSYGVKAPVLAQANGLGEDATLEAGQKLLIPLLFYADY